MSDTDKLPPRMYRMPYGFGPTAGPRQRPDGGRFASAGTPHKLTVATSFLTDPQCLRPLLPPGFELAGEPVVSVEFHVLSELEWLAGRGYSMLQVRFPAAFAGSRDRAVGSFLPVLWEDLADPIISGREELGFAKLWCELPPPRVTRDRIACTASWLAHPFCELEVSALGDATIGAAAPSPGLTGIASAGTLHYKYIPATQAWGNAAVQHACLSPASAAARPVSLRQGKGRVRFLPTTWEQMPTQFHIVQALAHLPQLAEREAWVAETRGASDYYDQRRLD